MAWTGSTRNQRLPGNWRRLRQAILHRDHFICQIQGPKCTGRAAEVDHIVPGDDHRPDNLQAVCQPCHQDKTVHETFINRPPRNRPPEPHPGDMGG